LTRIRARIATVALLLVLPTALVACGGREQAAVATTRIPTRSSRRPSTTRRRSTAATFNIGLSGSAEGTQSGAWTPRSPVRSGRSEQPQCLPPARPDRQGQCLGIRPEHRLRRLVDRHEGQRLRRVSGPGVRGRDCHLQRFEKSYEQQAQAQGGNQSAGSVFKRFGSTRRPGSRTSPTRARRTSMGRTRSTSTATRMSATSWPTSEGRPADARRHLAELHSAAGSTS